MMKITFKVHAAPPTPPGPVPIAQTTDGKCKVMTFEDGEETVTFGVDWNWVHVGAEDAYFLGWLGETPRPT